MPVDKKKSSVKKTSVKKTPVKKTPVKKTPVKKTMSKNAKIAAGVAAAIALTGASAYGAYKLKQRKDLQKEMSIPESNAVDYSKASIMKLISKIKAKANEARQKIITRFQKKEVSAVKAEEAMKDLAQEEENAIKEVEDAWIKAYS